MSLDFLLYTIDFMFKYIKTALDRISSLSEKHVERNDPESLMFAVAILLVEVMHADHHLDEQEELMVIHLLQEQFRLEDSAARSLFVKANGKMNDVVSLHQYTSHINAKLSRDEKLKLMVNLWKVVFSDGQIDKYEEHLIRRVADLIYIGHKNFIKAKHLAQD